MPSYLMYCRKSSEDEDRQVISNESQEDELSPIATRNSLRVQDRIKEEASAKAGGTRPYFNQMVNRIRKGEADAILCWHLNRLSRNAIDAAVLVDLMDQGKLVEIRTPGQAFRNTPGDKFLVTLFCSQAKLENDNKSEDVKRGLKKKAALGFYPGVAPLGYLNDKSKNRGERDLYNDPERFFLLKKMWQMMLTGAYTPPQILRIANEEWCFRTRKTKKQGGSPLSRSALYHVFHNPFYFGWYEYPLGSGKWYEGKHEPMVTKEEFERVQVLLGENASPRPSEHLAFPYTGLIRCGACGGMITAEEKRQVRCTRCRHKFASLHRSECPKCQTPLDQMRDAEPRRYIYYHCARRRAGCREPSVGAQELEQQIEAMLGSIHISTAFKEWASRYLHEIYSDDIKNTQHSVALREKALADCTARLEKLIDLKTRPENADGSLLSDEEYSSRRRKLLQEKAAIQSASHPKLEAERALRESEESFTVAHSASAEFRQGDFQARKELLARIGSNQILKDKILIFEAKKPFVLIQQLNAHAEAKTAWIEPENNLAKPRRNAPSAYVSLTRLRDVNKVRTSERKIKILVRKVYHHFRAIAAFGANINN